MPKMAIESEYVTDSEFESESEDCPKIETKKFRWRFTKFSRRKGKQLLSQVFLAAGHYWRICVLPKGNNDIGKFLSVYLELCDSDTVPDGSSVPADFSLTLIDQCDGSLPVRRCETENLNNRVYHCRFTDFLSLVDLHRLGHRYLVGDTVIIEAELSTEAPKTATESEDRPVRKKETKKFTWRITKFSTRKQSVLYSKTFSAGGHNWRICVFPKGNYNGNFKWLSVNLAIADREKVADGLIVPADFTLALIDQRNASQTVLRSTTHNFRLWDYDCGFTYFLPMVDLHFSDYGYLVRDTVIIEAEVSTEVAASEADRPHEPIKESLTKPLPLPSQDVQASNPFSPSNAQLTSRKLLAELSTMTSKCNSPSPDGISSSNTDHGSGGMQQQKEKLVGFLGMSLETICQTKTLDEVESTALEVVEHSTDPVEKTVLKALVSRLAEYKEVIPCSLSTIETSHGVESSVPQMTKDMEARLVHRKRKLSCLEVEVSRLGEEGMKLEAEIQQLSARKAELIDQRNSTMVELEKANEETSKELEKFKKQCDETDQAIEKRLKAKERVAQSNASWKLFKENLGW